MFKIIYSLFFIFIFKINGSCQSWGDSTFKHKKTFYSVEKNPKFPGGMVGFYEFVAKNLKAPENKKLSLFLNKVTVNIIISESGKVVFAEVEKMPYPELEKEKELYNEAALDLIKKMPDWTPGLQNGHQVVCFVSIPIVFFD